VIKYNFRYRGPFEYDKFKLNIFQFSNEVKYMAKVVKDGDLNLLDSKSSRLEELFNNLTSENGLMQQLLVLGMKTEQRGIADYGY